MIILLNFEVNFKDKQYFCMINSRLTLLALTLDHRTAFY